MRRKIPELRRYLYAEMGAWSTRNVHCLML